MNTQKQIFLIVVLFFVFVGACAGYAAIDLPIRAVDQQEWHEAESIERGALLFANNCRTCHGNMGQGGVGLPLNIDEYKNQDPLVLRNNRIKLTRTLECGRAGTLMQPWLNTNGGALNERQIEHLVNLITAPAESESDELASATGGAGTMTNTGWEEAEHFAHNLNHHTAVIVGGETLGTIAAGHLIGEHALSDLNGGIDPDEFLEPGTQIQIPGYNDDEDGYTYEVREDNETLSKIATNHQVGAIILAELNGIPYRFDADLQEFTLLNEEGRAISGLFPGDLLELPEGASYIVRAGQTLASIADQHGIPVSDLLTDANERVLSTTDPEEELEHERKLELPEGTVYQVQPGDTIGTVATKLNVEEEELLAANEALDAESTLLPGDALAVPDGARYTVATGETLDQIAGILGTTADELAQLNDIEPGDHFGPDIVIELPKINEYRVTGQSLEDLAATFANVTAESLAEANDIPADAVVQIGEELALPDDAWGNAPSDAKNPGTACVEFTVPENVFNDITGGGGGGGDVDRPTEVAQEVVIEGESNAWVVVADGERSEPNEGVVLVAPGTEIEVTINVGTHNIFIDDEEIVPLIQQGESQTLTFDDEGQFQVICTIHPGMEATVFVGEPGEAPDEEE